MSLFPDDKPGSSEKPIGAPPARETPRPNPSHAFEGGSIRVNKGAVQINVRKSRGGCLAPLIIIIIAAAICVPVFLFVIGPMTGLFNPYGEDTRAVPGDERAFDPIGSYAEILTYARGEAAEIDFVELVAQYVKRDGTLDLTASYNPSVTWEFIASAARPEDAPPVGAGGSAEDRYFVPVTVRAFQPGQMRSVSRSSGGVRTQYTYRHLGLERSEGSITTRRSAAVPPPTCSFKSLWDVAVERGAPAEAVATIVYRSGEYVFDIRDTGVRIRFDGDCAPLN